MLTAVQEISHLIEPLASAARAEASQLGHKVSGDKRGVLGVGWKRVPGPADPHSNTLPQVSQMAQYFEPLTLAAVGAASKTLSHPQQMALLDQTKTLAESALQLLYTAKEAGGNPKVLRAGREGLLLVRGVRSWNRTPHTHSLTPTHSKQLTPRKPWKRLCR